MQIVNLREAPPLGCKMVELIETPVLESHVGRLLEYKW